MLYLILAIASSALVSLVMRLSERFTRNALPMLAANYLMCTAAAAFLAGGVLPVGGGSGLAILLGSVCGVLYLAGFLLLNWNIRHSGVVLPATFQRLGVIVPTLAAMTIFGESPRWTQLLGVAVAVFAIVFMQPGARADKGGRVHLPGLLGLMLCGGISDVMSKVFQTWGNAAHANYFLVFIFVVALALSVVLCVVKQQRPALQDVLCGFALGIPNYMSARFLLWALRDVPAVVVYPTYSVGTIIVVTLVSVLAFREKLERRKLISLGMILGALVLLNL